MLPLLRVALRSLLDGDRLGRGLSVSEHAVAVQHRQFWGDRRRKAVFDWSARCLREASRRVSTLACLRSMYVKLLVDAGVLSQSGTLNLDARTPEADTPNYLHPPAGGYKSLDETEDGATERTNR